MVRKKHGLWPRRIKALVKKAGSMEALAVILKVSYYTISRWQTGANVPRRIAQSEIERIEKQWAKSSA